MTMAYQFSASLTLFRRSEHVRFGSLADIGEGFQGCPLYPQKRTYFIVGVDVCYVPITDIPTGMTILMIGGITLTDRVMEKKP